MDGLVIYRDTHGNGWYVGTEDGTRLSRHFGCYADAEETLFAMKDLGIEVVEEAL